MQQREQEPKSPLQQEQPSPQAPRGTGRQAAPPPAERREAPQITLPKGGGAIKGIEEKFEVNAVTGTAGFSIPLPGSPTRQGFAPSLGLSYDSGGGNSPFGLGWNVGVPSIVRKTEKQLPLYQDETESDVFLLAGAEDLVPLLRREGEAWQRVQLTITERGTTYSVSRYRPRIEGLFARIERWVDQATRDTHWRSVSPDNVHSVYGINAESRIADPEDASRVFEWLLSYTYDDKGNFIHYRYKVDQPDSLATLANRVFEKNRIGRSTNTYLERVLYGNKRPYHYGDDLPGADQFLFQTVFDYGEYADYTREDEQIFLPKNINEPQNAWAYRPDAFSSYRSGFDIRTYRRCRRVLHFHCFPELSQELDADRDDRPYLVESLELRYNDRPPDQWTAEETQGFSFLTRVVQYGHKWEGTRYRSRSLPHFDFSYQDHEWNTRVQDVPEESLHGAPIGIDSAEYQWIDLYNEGISGILTEQGDGWYYKSNLGGGTFAAPELVSPKPSFSGLRSGALQIQDLKGNGQKHLVSQQVEPKGFFELTPEAEWRPFRTFTQLPNRPLNDPHARFIDLNGDGVPELILSGEDLFLWYPAKGEEGYDPAIAVHKATDEEHGPAIVFADATQSIFLTDMNGDGLTDIARIRNGEICYWANLGYGYFSAKVTMENPPLFDHPEKYNPAYLRLADIDGSGTPDIIYLGQDEFRVWINRNGNSWTPGPKIINPFPKLDIEADVHVLDFLGTGTACIVWSSPLPVEAGRPLRYIDLMGGKKPHLMTGYRNNFGKTTILTYASSTHFYLADKKAGTPWITKLPFPVHVLAKTEVHDAVSQSRFAMKYTYHHGYYDYEEREFRGFGRVDTLDTESYEHYAAKKEGDTNSIQITDESFYQPPVLTKTWFHTGAFLEKEKILRQFAHEYFQNTAFAEYHLPDAVIELPEGTQLSGLSVAEYREALRACKSMTLRTEVYAKDKSDNENIPYTVAETNANIQLLQPKGENRHAVFVVKESETITYHYERNPADPRIAHTLNLEIDDIGNIKKSAAVVYPRVAIPQDLPDSVQKEQAKQHIVYSENEYTNDIGSLWDESRDFRHRELCEAKTYELTGVEPENDFFQLEELRHAAERATELEHQQSTTASAVEKRLIEHVRTLFLDIEDADKAFQQPLPWKKQNRLGLAYESYQLAFTSELLDDLYSDKVTEQMLTDGQYRSSAQLKAEGWFPSEDATGLWWDHEGTVEYAYPDTPADHFYMANRYCDPYGYCSKIDYDPFHLFVTRTEDARQNTTTVERFNYRTLQPERVKDENDNLTEVAFDTLGMVVGMAVMGKDKDDPAYPTDAGDDLEGFESDLTPEQIDAFFGDPLANGRALLGHATSRFVYDFRTAPIKVATINREVHWHAADGPSAPLQCAFAYSNGLGQVMLQKVQAEPGPAQVIEGNELVTRPADSRWVGTGLTILNNKGKPVMQFEPFFSGTHAYEDDRRIVAAGVTPVLYYDPLDRVIRTEMPNGTFTKVEFDAWQQKTYDTNDTVLDSEWFANQGSPELDKAEPTVLGNNPDFAKRAAWLAAQHANTPTVVHLDTLGRAFFTVAHNKISQFDNLGRVTGHTVQMLATEVVFDIEGNQRSIKDKPEENWRTVVRYHYDMLGGVCHQENMDRGPRWIFEDVLDKPLQAWKEEDASGACTTFSMAYDALHRPTEESILFSSGIRIINEKIEYGEDLPNKQEAKRKNLLGQVYRACDQVGIVTNEAYDFKDNLLHQTRQLCKTYDAAFIDWSQQVDLENETFTTRTEYDALNRQVQSLSPDGSITRPHYNEAGLLEQVEVQVAFDPAGVPNSPAPLEPPFRTVVRNIDYDAKGQRTAIAYGNGTKTTYEYDEQTYRLTNLKTTRTVDDQLEKLQDLYYYYDPEGNITTIQDHAQDTLYFDNQAVEAVGHYVYDAIYQLAQATGRELIKGNKSARTAQDLPIVTRQSGNGAVRRYRQRYAYDKAGNIESMRHIANGGSWTRAYAYSEKSYVEGEKDQYNNRLSQITSGNGTSGTKTFAHDHHGNMTQIPGVGVSDLVWNYDDHIQQIDLGGGGTVYYNYDPEKNRVRKVIQLADGTRKERLYLGNMEIYRVIQGETVTLERKTLHVSDGNSRILIFERTTSENGRPTSAREPLNTRYQYGNHLGSAALELDADAQIISYEEYHPYGTSAYRYGRFATEVQAKRYRYSGKERDAETGLDYYGARYYASWLGRWVSCDPIGVRDGLNVYGFVGNNSIKFKDNEGTDRTGGQLPDSIIQTIQNELAERAINKATARVKSSFARIVINYVKGKVLGKIFKGQLPVTPKDVFVSLWYGKGLASGALRRKYPPFFGIVSREGRLRVGKAQSHFNPYLVWKKIGRIQGKFKSKIDKNRWKVLMPMHRRLATIKRKLNEERERLKELTNKSYQDVRDKQFVDDNYQQFMVSYNKVMRIINKVSMSIFDFQRKLFSGKKLLNVNWRLKIQGGQKILDNLLRKGIINPKQVAVLEKLYGKNYFRGVCLFSGSCVSVRKYYNSLNNSSGYRVVFNLRDFILGTRVRVRVSEMKRITLPAY